MKRYTQKVVSKWGAAANLIEKVRAPKPFPGKTPTRIMLGVYIGNEKLFYIGKPSLTAYKAFQKWNNKIRDKIGLYYTVMYVEFDRGGIINLNTITKDAYANHKYNGPLWAHYHTEMMAEPWPNWLRFKFKVVDGGYKIA